MRWTVPDAHEDEWGSDEHHLPPQQVLRSRYAIGVGICAAFVIWVTGRLIGGALPAVGRWSIDHWPWLVAVPVSGLATWLIVRLLRFGRLFHPLSTAPLWLGWLLGLLVGMLVGLKLDTELGSAGRFASANQTDYVPLVLAIAAGLYATFGIRRVNLEYGIAWAWHAFLGIALIFLTYAILAIGSVLVDAGFFGAIRAAGSDLATEHWAPILLAVSAGLHYLVERRAHNQELAREYAVADEDGYETEESFAEPALITRRKRRNRHIFLLAAIDAPLVIYLALYYLPGMLVDIEGLTAAQASRALTDERRTLLAALAGIGAAATLIYTHLRHQLDRDADATGRYTQAIEQIGSKDVSVRLGGIYALERLGRDSPSDSSTIVEVLGAFVRQTAAASIPASQVPLDVIAAIQVLGRGPTGGALAADFRGAHLVNGPLMDVRFPRNADLRGANLSGCNLTEARLVAARLGGCDLTRAILTGANLEGARLSDVDLSTAKLDEVNLSAAVLDNVEAANVAWTGARLDGIQVSRGTFEKGDFRELSLNGSSFDRVVLRGAVLAESSMRECVFFGTDLSGVDGRSVNLTDAYLAEADVTHADFREADFTRANLREANLSWTKLAGANLRDADLSETKLEGCSYDTTTRWPSGFDFSRLVVERSR